MTEPAEAKNMYTCLACSFRVVTVNLVAGTTPMFLTCRADTNCGDRMVSSGYRLPLDAPAPTFEWYRPSQKKISRLRHIDSATADHVEKGGLLLRKIGAIS